MIDFAVAERPTVHVYRNTKWAGIVAAIIDTAQSGRAVQCSRDEVMSDYRRVYNSIRASVTRRAIHGMTMRTRSDGEHYYFWMEAKD